MKSPSMVIPSGPTREMNNVMNENESKELPHWGWGVRILPFMDYKNLYTSMMRAKTDDSSLFYTEAVNNELWIIKEMGKNGLLNRPISAFRCPSDRKNPTNGSRGDTWKVPPYVTDKSPSTANYIGCHGHYDWDRNSSRGVIRREGRLTFADLKDGTSLTFMVGERDWRCKAGTWVGRPKWEKNGDEQTGDYLYWTVGRTSVKLNHRNSQDKSGSDTAKFNGATCREGFSSAHQGGAHFLMCDGAVKFIKDSVPFDARNGLTTGDGDVSILGAASDGAVRKMWWNSTYQRLGVYDDNATLVFDF